MIGFLVLYVCVNVVAGFHTPQAEIAVLLTPKTIEIYNLIINGKIQIVVLICLMCLLLIPLHIFFRCTN